MKQTEVESFTLSKIKRKEPNPNIMKKNKKQKKGFLAKKFGILIQGTLVGGLKINRSQYQRLASGTYILESKKEERLTELLKSKDYGFITLKKERKENPMVSTLEIEKTDMKVMPNAVSVKHYDTKQQVDGSAYRVFEKGMSTTIKPGVYISEKDLKKAVRTKVEFHLPKLAIIKNKVKKEQSVEESSNLDELNINTQEKRKFHHIKKLCFASSFAALLAMSGTFALSNSEEQPSQVRVVEVTKQKEDHSTTKSKSHEASDDISVTTLEEPIQIGSAITLKEGSAYYKEASMESGETFVYNDYVNETDYNEITAVAIVDENNQIRFVSYEKGFEIRQAVEYATEHGIMNYQIMFHLGPIDQEVMDGANPYRLGWTNILNMGDATSKVYTK